MSITGGVFSYEDGRKADVEYAPPKKIRLDLRFDVEPGQDAGAVIDSAAFAAVSRVKALLGQKVDMPSPTAGAIEAPPAVGEAPEATKRTRRTKEQIAADEAAAAKGTLPAVDPFPAVSNAVPAAAAVGAAPASAAENACDVTDKMLFDNVVAANAKYKKPTEITAIITKFCPLDKPPGLKLIPADQRHAFLNELAAWMKGLENASADGIPLG